MKKIYLFLLLISSSVVIYAQKNKVNLLVGTYTNSCNSRGIYVYEFDTNNAQIRLKKSSDSIVSPSYLALSNDEKFIYAVNENGKQSTVSSLSFDAVSGKPSLLNSVSSKGDDPCYIINDDSNVIVANYSGGNISVFGKKEDGSLTDAKQVIQHYGKGVKVQQQKPHVHMVYFSPDKKYVLSNDLGTDKVYVYNYNPTAIADVLSLKDSVSVKAGSGPRHLTFSKNGKFVYLLQELDGSLTTFSYADGKLTKINETSILAKDYKGTFSSADIHISPNGKFLYASNRGDANNITIFKISGKGKLRSKGQVSTLGKGPRNFVIDPTGKFLLVAHQYTNDIVIFKINKKRGTLTDTKKRIDLCSPVCLVFAK
ncbi:lactonase family protein [Flavobacterium gilvum]|uniref:6-phosphogluconolactonase n=1 Tax=Flavobacterium gilvum TaxID=1492737 RepID=A0AAC9N3Y6_9FLAO|nr:lactonase family protein [Flavobacterium gilvum]AOW09730.1 6-phosphogluconolactonase [Flavobacterium gilvum]KFC57692.1 6-phosphogluconolactonase [Flavobacterium gilvum]